MYASHVINHCMYFSILAGAAISLAYEDVHKKVGSVGLHVAVGGISRGKTNCAQICLAAMGNYPCGSHQYLTESVARAYMANGVPFLYDDPSNMDVLKPILMNSFGGAKMTTQHGEFVARCSPLITANDALIDDLSKADER